MSAGSLDTGHVLAQGTHHGDWREWATPALLPQMCTSHAWVNLATKSRLPVDTGRSHVLPDADTLQVAGLVETSPGVRSVMVEYEPRELGLAKLLEVHGC
jgi:hypothetical protein